MSAAQHASRASSQAGSEYGCAVEPETQMAPRSDRPQRPLKRREHRPVNPGSIASSKQSMPTLEHGAVLRAKPSSPTPRRILDATGKTGDREDCLDHASAPAAPSSRSASAAFNVVDIQLGHIEHGAAETELLENVKPHEANGRTNALCPPIPEHIREASQDGSAFFQLSKDASMRFTGGYEYRKTVGTLEEVARMSRAARVELAMFSSTPLPEEMTYMETLMFGMLIFNFRKPLDVLMSCIPVLDRHLRKRRAFTRSIIKAGGLERIQLLISIARFDTDGDNQVSEMEFMKSAFAGTICITNAVAVVQGFSLISGLIFVSTHLASIGRPRGWRPEPGAVESFGEDETTIVMWVVYSLNLFAETLALSVMINSVFMRQLLNNALPSVHRCRRQLSAPRPPACCTTRSLQSLTAARTPRLHLPPKPHGAARGASAPYVSPRPTAATRRRS